MPAKFLANLHVILQNVTTLSFINISEKQWHNLILARMGVHTKSMYLLYMWVFCIDRKNILIHA